MQTEMKHHLEEHGVIFRTFGSCTSVSCGQKDLRLSVFREGCGMLPLFLQGLLGPNPVFSMGVGQGTSWMSHQLIAGSLLMAVAASTRIKDASIIVAQSRELGFEPAIF